MSQHLNLERKSKIIIAQSTMNLQTKPYTLAALVLAAAVSLAEAAPVILTVDETADGLAFANHTPFATGFLEIGWLNVGVTQAEILAHFNSGNLGGIDSAFNTVFSLSIPGDLVPANIYASGVFDHTVTLVPDNNASALATYQADVAGKQMFAWIRDASGLGSTTQMAFVAGDNFPAASDTVNFTDFGGTFASFAGSVWIGSQAAVINGDAIDLNGGSPADGLNFAGGSTVLQMAAVVPEPSTGLVFLAGAVAFVSRRRRNS